MRRPVIIEAQDVGKLIKDDAIVTSCGVSGTMLPDLALSGMEISFLTTGHPRNLTLAFPCPFGYSEVEGADHFAHEGLLKRVIGSSFHSRYSPNMCNMVRQAVCEGYVFPLGVFYQLVRDISAGLPGTFSQVGLGTFVDPRLEGGKLNPKSNEDMVELVTVSGREMLFYKGFPIDVAIVRGTTADEEGNISLEEEPNTLDPLHQALAAHNSGGIVICQVKRVAAKGSIHPRMVEIPGILIDYIVVDPNQKQLSQLPSYNPAFSGEIRVPDPPITPVAMSPEKMISRRALMDLGQGMIVNLGAGIPLNSGLTLVAREEHVAPQVHFSVEHGTLGGVNLGSHVHVNPTSFLTAVDVMDLYHGAGLDQSFLGFIEIDRFGNANLGRLGGITEGPGGSIDIAASTKKLTFLGLFTHDGLKVEANDGKLRIVTEGKVKKFVNDVQAIFFSAEYAKRSGHQIKYITERAVLELRDQGLVITEIAPGVDLERDVIGQMEFRPGVDEHLKQMDAAIFKEPVIGIGAKMKEAAEKSFRD